MEETVYVIHVAYPSEVITVQVSSKVYSLYALHDFMTKKEPVILKAVAGLEAVVDFSKVYVIGEWRKKT